MSVFFFALAFHFTLIVGKDLIDFSGYLNCDRLTAAIKNRNVTHGSLLCSVIQAEKNAMGEMFIIRIRDSSHAAHTTRTGCGAILHNDQNSFTGAQFDYSYQFFHIQYLRNFIEGLSLYTSEIRRGKR